MGLKHLNYPTDEVETAGGAFAVRGLSFEDIVLIVRQHAQALSALFDMLRDGKTEVSLEDAQALAAALAQAAPEVVAVVIARAADEPDVAAARKLPFPVQIEALEKIAKLTFATEGGPKKVLETIIRVANGMSTTMTSLKA